MVHVEAENQRSTIDVHQRGSIKSKNSSYYSTISLRNDWYAWADKISRAKPGGNYWFQAAADVTSWRAVGAADWINLGYITNEEEYIMRGVNADLLTKNFINFGEYLLSPTGCVSYDGVSFCGLTGAALEKKMVDIEQSEVEKLIGSVKIEFELKFGKDKTDCFAASGYTSLLPFVNETQLTPWECAIWGINRVSDGSCKTCYLNNALVYVLKLGTDAYSFAKSEFQKTYPGENSYNFLMFNHRKFIGYKMAEYIRNNP